MIQLGEHQEQLLGYVNGKELKKAVWNSGTAGIATALVLAMIGNIVVHIDDIVPNAPVISGLAVMVLGMIGSQLRSMSFGKVVVPVNPDVVAAIPPDTPVTLVNPTPEPIQPGEVVQVRVPAPKERDTLMEQLRKSVAESKGDTLVLPIHPSGNHCELIDIDGKIWYRDTWTGAAFETEEAYLEWCDAGSKLNEVPGGLFIEDGKRFVYTVKRSEPIHYETRTGEDTPENSLS